MVRAVWAGALAIALVACSGSGGSTPAPSPPASDGGDTGFACVPKTCSELGACGSVSDGCGQTLACGACPDGGSGASDGGGLDGGAGGGGTLDGGTGGGSAGATRWVVQRDLLAFIAADGAGNLFVTHSGGGQLVVEKLDSSGRSLWSKQEPSDAPVVSRIAVSPLGNLFIAGDACPDDFHGPCGELWKLGPSGEVVWKQGIAFMGFMGLAVDTHGSAILLEGGGSAEFVAKYNYDGTLAWRQMLQADARGVATDGADHVIIVGGASGEIIDGDARTDVGTPGAETPFILELDRQGQPVWLDTLKGAQPAFDAVGTSAKGTVVALGTVSGSFTWSGQRFDSGPAQPIVVVAEASGAPRLAVRPGLPTAYVLAVDPAGKAAIAGTNDSRTDVAEYDLAGDLLWTKQLDGDHTRESGPNGLRVQCGAVLANHDVVFLGNFHGTESFGGPTLTATHPFGNGDGFLLDLAP